MSYKQVPITAKILKTTKGGVTQPILNMGAAVGKMKAPSPNKQVGTVIYQGAKQAIKKSLPSVKKYATEVIKKASKTKVPSVKKPIKTINVKANATKKLPAPKAKPKAKYTNTQKLVMAAVATAAVVGKGDTDKKVTPTPNTTTNTTPKKGKSYDQAYKDRDKKVYGGMDKSSYIKEAKRQNASYKKTGKYDVKSSYDKPKAKAANTIKSKGVKDVASNKNATLETKLDPKVLKTQVAKVNSKKVEPSKGNVRKANRKLDSADRKDSRAAKVAQKAKEARASGNTAKADRLKRREARINKRANKKRGQAASAIQPK
tara:strand:+ start:104 stop:1051 length:948 start_codon:yes stop_codon:yes gene_type:complete